MIGSLGREGLLEKEIAPTPVFLPGRSRGQGAWRLQSEGLGGLDTTERLSISEHFYFCRQNKTKPVTSPGLGQGLRRLQTHSVAAGRPPVRAGRGPPCLSALIPAAVHGFHGAASSLPWVRQFLSILLFFMPLKMELISAPGHPQHIPGNLAGVQMLRTHSVGKKKRERQNGTDFLIAFSVSLLLVSTHAVDFLVRFVSCHSAGILRISYISDHSICQRRSFYFFRSPGSLWYRCDPAEKTWWCLVAQACPTLSTPWAAARQAPLSMEFPRPEYWSE